MIRLPDVNIARARKTLASNTKRNENKFELSALHSKVKFQNAFRHVIGRKNTKSR